MTEKDKELIARAERTPYARWSDVLDYIEQADTEEAKIQLDKIASRLSHLEEYFAGCL